MIVTTAIPLSEGLAVFPILSSGLNEPLLSFVKKKRLLGKTVK